MEDGRGLGYAGGIADIRLSDDGEIKALTLSEPNRFIYMIGGKPKEKGHFSLMGSLGSMLRGDDAGTSVGAGLVMEEAKPVGGAIYLPAAHIRNMLVLNYSEQALTVVTQDPAPTPKPPAPMGKRKRARAAVARFLSWLLR